MAKKHTHTDHNEMSPEETLAQAIKTLRGASGIEDVAKGVSHHDPVNHPSHYTHGSIEVIDVIEDWKLGFCLGNSVKYIARADHKGRRLEDLKKAAWYLQREIEREEKT